MKSQLIRFTRKNMLNIRKWGAYMGAGAVIFSLAGCADRNKNGQPDDVATSGEVSNAVDSAENKAAPAMERAGDAASNAASSAGNAISGAAEVATVTPKVKTALGANKGLDGSKIDVDTLPEKDSIALRGTVKTAAQKTLAEKIAKNNAPGYKVVNQLKVGS
ncbi:BON domain-containing protein [bacterium]|nr:MAG: BON domain-containing protein [bacterium]